MITMDVQDRNKLDKIDFYYLDCFYYNIVPITQHNIDEGFDEYFSFTSLQLLFLQVNLIIVQ